MLKRRFILWAAALTITGAGALFAAEVFSTDQADADCTEETSCLLSWCPWE